MTMEPVTRRWFPLLFLGILVLQSGFMDCWDGERGRTRSSNSKRTHVRKSRVTSTSDSSNSRENNKLIGIIIGSAIGGLIALTITVFLAYYFCSSKRSSRQVTAVSNEVQMDQQSHDSF